MVKTELNLQPGDMLGGRYRIEAKVGEGGMGAVYRAFDEHNMRREVAVKIIGSNINQAQRESARLRLSREREAALRIVHPNVVQVIDSGMTEQGDIYLVQEFIHGEPLDKVLKRRLRLEYDEIIMILNQMGSALEAAHSEGIVHRDLKPANVMLQNLSGGGKQVKVIDFGIAKVQESAVDGKLTGTGAVLGTPLYASPEQLQSFLPDPKMDLWGLAIMTYEMVTGVVPFYADSVTAVFLRQMEGPKPPKALRPDLPDEAQKVLLKALSYKPDDRYLSVREYCAALTQAFANSQAGRTAPDPEPVKKTELTFVVNPAETIIRIPQHGTSKKTPWTPIYIGVALIIGIVAVGLYSYAFNSSKPAIDSSKPAIDSKPATLSFCLMVKDDRGEPYFASGREIYRSGDQFKLIIRQAKQKNLYIFNEGTDGDLTMLFPASRINDGSSSVKENEIILPSEKWFQFDKTVGEEHLIFVLSSQPIDLMEGLNYKGIISDPAKAAEIRAWIKSKEQRPDQKNESYETILTVPDEPLIARISLQHR